MDVSRTAVWAKGLVLATLYCAGFLLCWYLSEDQWYLPAGLRAAGLLFLPYRYWPYLFVGDAAAMLVLRGPKAEQYSVQWAYLSPFLLAPMIAAVPAIFRRFIDVAMQERWIPLIAITMGIWAAVANMLLNQVLAGPAADNTLEMFIRFSVGQFLGIVMLAVPVLIWMRRRESHWTLSRMGANSLVAAGFLALLCVAVETGPMEPSLKVTLLLLTAAPAVALTFVHGWRGAVIGAALMNFTVGMALPTMNTAGAHEATTFISQQVLAIASTALLVLGSIISEHYARARDLGLAEQHALRIAQTCFLSTERQLRDRVRALADIQAHVAESRKELIEVLKLKGHYAAAMDLTRHGVLHAEMFDEQAAALYPVRIEQRGLYDVLQSAGFSMIWAGGTEIRYVLRGRPRTLPVDLQMAAYRCTCNALALLAGATPSRYLIRGRTWDTAHQRGIVISVTAISSQPVQHSVMDALAGLELEGRVKAHGGALRRRHANVISFLLAEPAGAADRDQSLAGAIHQASPFSPGYLHTSNSLER